MSDLSAEEKVRRAILKILARNKLKLFGCIIYKFDIKLIEDPELTACCYVDIQTRKPVIAINKNFIDKDIPTVEEAIYLILHEMIHFIDGHNSKIRTENKDPQIFNLAADHIINSMLDEDAKSELNGLIKSPTHRFLVKELIGQDLTLMEVYEWLVNNYQFIRIQINGDGTADVTIKGKNQGTITLDLNQPGENGSAGDKESGEVEKELKAEIRSIIDNVLSQKIKGTGSSKLYEYIDKLTKVEVPWEVILENAIHTTLAKSNTNRSWKNIHKRYRSLGITLPTYANDTVLDKLYVFQDTSGSMSTEDQRKFVDILFQSINFFHSIIILQHDSKIVSTLELNRENFEQQKEEVFKIHGRGGTSHIECFQHVENVFFDEDERIGIILALTDYYSDIEYLWDKFEFHKYIPFKVICTEKNIKIAPHVDPKPIYI